MTEKAVKTKNGKYGLYGVLDHKSDKSIVIFVHGLKGHSHVQNIYNSVVPCMGAGFSVLRISLYSDKEDARQLENTCISEHSSDIEAWIKWARRRYSSIHIVGHSLAGPSIANANLQIVKGVKSVVLWDPSNNIFPFFKKDGRLRYVKSLNKYLMGKRTATVLSKKMVEEFRTLTNLEKMISDVHIPIKFIYAGKGILFGKSKQVYQNANFPKAYVVIKNADHTFTNRAWTRALIAETVSWLKKHK